MITAVTSQGCLTVTLDRPDKANALTEEMLKDMVAAITKSDARVLIVTGAGTVFSAGGDLDDVRENSLAVSPEWERLSSAISDFPGLSIAALNGSCAGGAMGMILACDLRICVPTATFFYPVIKIGVLPQPSDPARLCALVGPAVTKKILLTGARLDAVEAQLRGLVDHISSDDLMTDVRTMIAPTLAADRQQVAAIKALIDA